MTCVEVRDRLAEHAMGLLEEDEAETVDRHLGLCPGCWKEFSELSEGATVVGMALPTAEAPPSLEHKVVQRITATAGTRLPASRPPIVPPTSCCPGTSLPNWSLSGSETDVRRLATD